jgi:DNA-binding transcriptional ArsR family regulator
MANFRPKYRCVLKNAREFHAIKHPLAQALLQVLQDQEMTLQQASDRLGLKAGHLRYHLRRLLEAGLIKLTRKRDTGRNLEKYYRAVAYRFGLPARSRRDPEIERLCVEGYAALVLEYAARMNRTEGEWIEEINRVRLLPEDLEELRAKVERLLISYRKKRARNPQARDYKSSWICFPIAGTGSEP